MNTDNLGKNLMMFAAVVILLVGAFAIWKSRCGEKCETESTKVAEAMNAPLVIYTIPNCSFCKRAKALLDEKGIAYKEIDVSNDEAMREKLVEMTGGRTTVPQIFIHGKPVGGFTDIEKLNNEGKLVEMLAAGAAAPSQDPMQNPPETPYTPEPAPTTETAAPGVVEGEPSGVVNAEQSNPQDLPAGVVEENNAAATPAEETQSQDEAPTPESEDVPSAN